MPREGVLVQIDGSYHDWLEGRGPWLTLLLAVDDATGPFPGLCSANTKTLRVTSGCFGGLSKIEGCHWQCTPTGMLYFSPRAVRLKQ